MSEADAETPRWFDEALAHEPEVGTVECRGCDINFLAWGTPGDPGLIFVHGGAAHAHWWSFLVPHLADHYRVVAMDLSGHGDSDRRDPYSLDNWAAEVIAVAHASQMAPRPVVVGHSMGGFVSIAAAALYEDDVAGVVILDSPVTAPDPETEAARTGNIFGPLRVYTTEDEALARFHTVPVQKNYLDYVIDHVSRNSLKPVPGGFSWKFDPGIFVPNRDERRELLSQVKCRVSLFRAQYGLVTPEIGEYMYGLLGRVAPVVEIPAAGHHLMLDRPLLVLTALRTLLADWEHSSPITRRS